MTDYLKKNYLFFFLTTLPLLGNTQIVDFEHFSGLTPGDPIGTIAVGETRFRIFKSYNLKDSTSLTLQKVAHEAPSGGYYGPSYSFDCEGHPIPPIRKNQINDSLYALNSTFTNRERIGCYFISCDLQGQTLPSVFIQYEQPNQFCSADLIDVDGHENTIEAYDIYLYAETADYPHNPIHSNPIEIRSLGKTYGPGLIGDNGGVLPVKIESEQPFILIEFRPIQQITPQNDIRYDFGFAFDNFSPISLEKAPYTPPYLIKDNHAAISHIPNQTAHGRTFVIRNEAIYFGFDQSNLSKEALAILKDVLDDIESLLNRSEEMEVILKLSAYTDPVGETAYNEWLSQKRVKAAANYFKQRGIPAQLIETNYFGEAYPEKTADPAWKKRTVQIELSYRKK